LKYLNEIYFYSVLAYEDRRPTAKWPITEKNHITETQITKCNKQAVAI